MQHLYNSYSESLEKRYGYRIYRVGVDAGFSCPNRRPDRSGGCVYCDSQGATAAYLRSPESGLGKNFIEDIDNCVSHQTASIQQQIEKGLEFLKRRYKASHFSLYFQSYSNTFAPVGKLDEIYSEALGERTWEEFIVSTRSDCIDKNKLELLASYKNRVKTVCVELGLQSGDDEILKAMNRGHDVASVIKASKMIKDYGLELCLHLIFGFPGENLEKLDKTISVVNTIHPDAVKIHNLNVVAGTDLYKRYQEAPFEVPDAEAHIKNTIYFLRRIPDDVVIERLMCETPAHRLAAPRNFPDKNSYIMMLDRKMEELGVKQGDLFREKL